MTVRTWVGRFCVVDGQVTGGRTLARLSHPPGSRRRSGRALRPSFEPASPASAEFTSQLVDVIARLYHKDPLSLTGALVRSLRGAHDHLVEWNRNSLKEHRVGAGVSCLALRGNNAYLAQAGGGIAYVRSVGGDLSN